MKQAALVNELSQARKMVIMISRLCLVRRKLYWPFWEFYADFVEFYVIKL